MCVWKTLRVGELFLGGSRDPCISYCFQRFQEGFSWVEKVRGICAGMTIAGLGVREVFASDAACGFRSLFLNN